MVDRIEVANRAKRWRDCSTRTCSPAYAETIPKQHFRDAVSPRRLHSSLLSNYAIIPSAGQLLPLSQGVVPPLFVDKSGKTWRRFVEFFAAQIRNHGTREVYFRAAVRFGRWCEERGITELAQVNPVIVAAYVEDLQRVLAAPTVKVHLAGIRMLFDFLVTGHALEFNPAASVRGPRHVVKKGKTPVLLAEEARQLLDSIDTTKIAGLRDRALIGVMVFSFARVGAVVGMDVEDYFQQGKRYWFRLHEKGGKRHDVPAHHVVEAYVDDYVQAAGIGAARGTPLFRTLDRHRRLAARRLQRREVLAMVNRRARAAGLPESTCCHTFRATGITAYLRNGGTIEKAAAIASHESTRTTQLYNRTADELTLDEIERILI